MNGGLQSAKTSQSSTSTTLKLSWSGGDPDGDTVTYRIYLEKGNSTPDNPIATTTATTIYYSIDLQAGATYYWKVVADDGKAITSGPVWHFYVKNNNDETSNSIETSEVTNVA